MNVDHEGTITIVSLVLSLLTLLVAGLHRLYKRLRSLATASSTSSDPKGDNRYVLSPSRVYSASHRHLITVLYSRAKSRPTRISPRLTPTCHHHHQPQRPFVLTTTTTTTMTMTAALLPHLCGVPQPQKTTPPLGPSRIPLGWPSRGPRPSPYHHLDLCWLSYHLKTPSQPRSKAVLAPPDSRFDFVLILF